MKINKPSNLTNVHNLTCWWCRRL